MSEPDHILMLHRGYKERTSSLITLLSRDGRPVLLYDDIRPERREIVMGAYLRGAYLLDPFYDCLLAGPREWVVPLPDIQPDHFRKSRYFSSYYADVGLADEIGMFVSRRDGSHVFASIGRARGMEAFSKKGIERLRHFQPVVEHLMQRQWDAEPLGAREEEAGRRAPSFLTLDEALRRSEFRSLSAREREIVALILKGHSSKSVADHLGIAVGTVKNHRKSIYRRLAISSQSACSHGFCAASATPLGNRRSSRRGPGRAGTCVSLRGHGQIRMATLT